MLTASCLLMFPFGTSNSILSNSPFQPFSQTYQIVLLNQELLKSLHLRHSAEIVSRQREVPGPVARVPGSSVKIDVEDEEKERTECVQLVGTLTRECNEEHPPHSPQT